jgi:uncharacterized protein (TIGR02284 family)
MSDTINTLIRTCDDGQYYFEHAAKNIGDSGLRAELMQYSIQRREFAANLRQACEAVGETAISPAVSVQAQHLCRIYRDDDHLILAAVERLEADARTAYRSAMAETVPAGVDDLIETQYCAVKHVHARIESLTAASAPLRL